MLFLPFPRNSDMAGTLLAGQDMAAGNWRLCGWWMPSDSYATLDVPLYAVLAWLHDPPSLAMLHAGAIIWGAVVSLALAMVRGAGGLIAVLATLALPITFLGGPVHMLSESPMHVSMTAAVLAAFLALSGYVGRPRAWLLAGYAAILTLAVIGDPLALVVGGAPVLAASLICLRAGAPRRIHLPVCLATLGALLAAPALVAWNARTGGFQPSPVPHGLTEWGRILPDLTHIGQWITQFLGASSGPGADISWLAHPGRAIMLLRLPLALLWLAGLALVCGRAARGLRDRKTLPDYLDLLLAASVLADIGATVASGIVVDEVSARYVLPAFVCGAVLMARRCSVGGLARAYFCLALAGSVAAGMRAVLAGPKAPVLAQPGIAELASLLRREGLRTGYAPYYSAAILTAVSDNAVASRAVWLAPDGRLAPFPWLANAAWFRPDAGQGDRVFFLIHDDRSDDGFGEAAVLDLMGPPARRLRSGRTTVDIYPASAAGLRQLYPPHRS